MEGFANLLERGGSELGSRKVQARVSSVGEGEIDFRGSLTANERKLSTCAEK